MPRVKKPVKSSSSTRYGSKFINDIMINVIDKHVSSGVKNGPAV